LCIIMHSWKLLLLLLCYLLSFSIMISQSLHSNLKPLTSKLLMHPSYAFGGLSTKLFSKGNKRIFSNLASSGEADVAKKFRFHFENEKREKISPWHDIPYKDSFDNYRFVSEIPKYSKAKFEIATKEELNPIAQDIKNGKLRDYHGPIYWNYGAIPQTWENPHVIQSMTQCKGDNDPIDVVEIGSKILPSGSVHLIKVLGILALIDDGELDWKVIAIKSDDPLANELNDIEDVENKLHGYITGIREWFRWYKTPDNKPLNKFGYDEKALNREFAINIIEETHHYWKDLVTGKVEKSALWVPDH